ncbi:MAG: DUF1611 domain-containing protein [Burkholderiales bacterium]|nr:DUF1611 domain-containing protein [Burkholderiales bacterium]
MRTPAIVLANGRYQTPNGKVAHGLVRGSDRFEVMAVVEPALAGRDAGEALDGRHRGIPVVATIDEAIEIARRPPETCVVGIATHGGRFTPELRELILAAVKRGLAIVNGLHDAASEDADIAAAAAAAGVTLTDLRKARPKHELHFWEGYIHGVRAPRVAVLGTDCALGKRTTTRMLVQALNAAGVRAEMIYTGQTGWMQGARYGFVLDSVINDYVSGELEHAIVTCDREAGPDVMVIEGQSSLRNPSGPCGAEFLLSGAARAVILQHAAGREFFEGYERQGLRIPPLADEIALIRMYGARTLAVTLNSAAVGADELARIQRDYERELGIPVVCPLEEGVERLVPVVEAYLAESAAMPSA